MSMTYKEARKLLEHYRTTTRLERCPCSSPRNLLSALEAFDGRIDELEDQLHEEQDRDCSDQDWGV